MMRIPIAMGAAAVWLLSLAAGQRPDDHASHAAALAAGADVAAELARQRNAEIDASIARVQARRAAEHVRLRNAAIRDEMARHSTLRATLAFGWQRNAEIDASIA